jgi:uncharacterized LabA/DUF88 family protein
LADTRLKIAVFIDFDNIEIGVKSTLGAQFDVGVVLEALKERGDVVSKIAYGDWTRAGDYSRSLTQHATKLVQRNLTPGGDKNGADINLALDALEMAFTHSHINAYVIVGGDSDFITLVEKLKQYDKQIFVVGGRAFTSLVMQRNCHEFIAYENLVSSRRTPERGPRTGPVAATQTTSLDQAVPLVRRALKVLTDREVSPQLGLLKSTLLQLDSTFSERTYGAGSFRDFAQKLAAAGHVTLRESGRNVLVELADGAIPRADEASTRPLPFRDAAEGEAPADAPAASPAGAASPAPAAAPAEPRVADGIREVRRLFQSAQNPPRWPMYIRQAKQFLRNVDATFDERRFGFASLVDLMRACQRENLFRIERDRQGVMRIFPGNVMQAVSEPETSEPDDSEESDQRDFLGTAEKETTGESTTTEPWRPEPGNTAESWRPEPGNTAEPWRPEPNDAAETEVVEGDVLQEMEAPQPVIDGEAEPVEPPPSTRRRKPRPAPRGQGARKAADAPPAPRARKSPSRSRSTRSRPKKEPADS